MKNVKFKHISLIFIFIYLLICRQPVAGQPVVQLVESIPVETSLGDHETARTADVWLNMIKSAAKTIDMEIFYLSHKQGEALTPILRELTAAAQRGVIVRILTDAKMATTYPATLDSLDVQPNISVRTIQYFNRLGGVMHAKYFIVDSQQIFMGSQNMDWRALEHIHELGIYIRNNKLSQLIGKIFDLDWQLAFSGEQTMLPSLDLNIVINRTLPLMLLNTPGDTISLYPTFSPAAATYPQLERDQTEIIELIENAKERLEIQLLSYKPASGKFFYEKLDNTLREAAVRGVKIRMIVSDWNTRHPDIQFLKSLQVIPNIDIKISTIPQWSGGFIPYARVEHCKYMVVDSQYTWMGTSNWSWSYFHNSRNIGLIIKNRSLNQKTHRIFSRSWDSSYCRDLDISRDYSPPKISGEESQ